MSKFLSDELLKEELTPEQYEEYQRLSKEEGEDEALMYAAFLTNRYTTELHTCVNQRIKELRKENNLTQIDLANILRVSQKEYWRYEQEGYSLNILTLANIAIFYNVSIDWISGFHQKRKPFCEGENVRNYVNGYCLQDFKEAKAKGIKYPFNNI